MAVHPLLDIVSRIGSKFLLGRSRLQSPNWDKLAKMPELSLAEQQPRCPPKLLFPAAPFFFLSSFMFLSLFGCQRLQAHFPLPQTFYFHFSPLVMSRMSFDHDHQYSRPCAIFLGGLSTRVAAVVEASVSSATFRCTRSRLSNATPSIYSHEWLHLSLQLSLRMRWHVV